MIMRDARFEPKASGVGGLSAGAWTLPPRVDFVDQGRLFVGAGVSFSLLYGVQASLRRLAHHDGGDAQELGV